MDEETGDLWRRYGTSLVWDANALHEAASVGTTVSLRQALEWSEPNAMPEEPPAGKRVVVVTGLRTILDALPTAERDQTLERVAMLVRAQAAEWPETAIVFALPEGTRLRVAPPTGTVVMDVDGDGILELGAKIWGGAGTEARALVSIRRDNKGNEVRVPIGYWLRRVS